MLTRFVFSLLMVLISQLSFAAVGELTETPSSKTEKNIRLKRKSVKAKKTIHLKRKKVKRLNPDWNKISVFLVFVFISLGLLLSLVLGFAFLLFSNFWIGFLIGAAISALIIILLWTMG